MTSCTFSIGIMKPGILASAGASAGQMSRQDSTNEPPFQAAAKPALS